MGTVVKGLAILGSTGSIGTQTLDVVRTFAHAFRVVGLGARKNLDLLKSQVMEFRPQLFSCEGTIDAKATLTSDGCEDSSLETMACHPDVDIVVTATVGDVALGPTIAALDSGKTIALANKESIVMAGDLLTGLARERGVEILPVDSEPNAIWQCLKGEDSEVSRLIITASGGAFRGATKDELGDVTPERALAHPTWRMGPKITVDSATLMNKAFEVIEAHYLFGVPWDRIEVVIHPQSIIHSMVEFVDGSVKAQISPPDMRLPIQCVLFHPDRVKNASLTRFDPIATGALTFEPMDVEKYTCFGMALEVGMLGDTWPAALCGADEMAVDKFLLGNIGFLEIAPLIREVLDDHQPVAQPTISDLMEASRWARARVAEIVEV